MDSLVTLIARQSELKILDLRANGFTEEQEQRVRSAVVNTACRVIFTGEEYDAYRAEQAEVNYGEELEASYYFESEANNEEQEEAEAAASAT